MSAYRTVVVGTDGSDSSLRAVEKAGSIAGANAKLIVATAYLPQDEDARAADALKEESYKVSGSAPIYAILREAKERAECGRSRERRRTVDRRRAGRRAGRTRRRGRRRPARRRQRRPEHDRRPAAGVGARQRLAPSQGRRADRSHHHVSGRTRVNPVIDTAKYGPWALIAGGSEGVGAEFARLLAASGSESGAGCPHSGRIGADGRAVPRERR